jgi:predicted enzyme related to lactoylglutathione lyase
MAARHSSSAKLPVNEELVITRVFDAPREDVWKAWTDPTRSDFYKRVFQKDPDWSEGGYNGFMAGKGFINFYPHDKVQGRNANLERMMFNFEIKDVKGEFERIKKLGAAVVAEPYNPMEDPKGMIATFADPDNNYFQLVTPWENK